MLEPADKLAALSWFAKQWVGVVDDGAGVGDKLVDAFRESLNKNPSGEAWCADFVAFCADAVDALAAAVGAESLPGTVLAKTEWTQGLWFQTPTAQRLAAPVVGCVVVWAELGPDGQPNGSGHCGVVTGVTPNGDILTVEGNTSQPGSTGSESAGRGVWPKLRAQGNVPGFSRLGYLLPWQV